MMCTNLNSRVYGDHPGRTLVEPNLGEDGSKKADYNRNVWNWERLHECRVAGLQGKHTPEVRSFSFAEGHQEVQMRRARGCGLLSSQEAVESCIGS